LTVILTPYMDIHGRRGSSGPCSAARVRLCLRVCWACSSARAGAAVCCARAGPARSLMRCTETRTRPTRGFAAARRLGPCRVSAHRSAHGLRNRGHGDSLQRSRQVTATRCSASFASPAISFVRARRGQSPHPQQRHVTTGAAGRRLRQARLRPPARRRYAARPAPAHAGCASCSLPRPRCGRVRRASPALSCSTVLAAMLHLPCALSLPLALAPVLRPSHCLPWAPVDPCSSSPPPRSLSAWASSPCPPSP
jgi:hypothetical protein